MTCSGGTKAHAAAASLQYNPTAGAIPGENGPMSTDPIVDVIARWHRFIRGETPGSVEDLLADDVVFYSPIVYTPQAGKAITAMYLTAAGATLGGSSGDSEGTDTSDAGKFRYTKEVLSGDTAVLEFESSIEGKYLNGVDIIRCNADGQIVEFRVMIRPLQAINAVHAQMKAALEAMQAG